MEDDVEEILNADNEDDGEEEEDIPEVVGESGIHGGTVVSVPHPQSVVSACPAPPPQGTGEWVLHCIKAEDDDLAPACGGHSSEWCWFGVFQGCQVGGLVGQQGASCCRHLACLAHQLGIPLLPQAASSSTGCHHLEGPSSDGEGSS